MKKSKNKARIMPDSSSTSGILDTILPRMKVSKEEKEAFAELSAYLQAIDAFIEEDKPVFDKKLSLFFVEGETKYKTRWKKNPDNYLGYCVYAKFCLSLKPFLEKRITRLLAEIYDEGVAIFGKEKVDKIFRK
ncbi:MAG: hypothetical protein ABIH83_05725 [Candidatus Micrarchaeota archaeon]